MTGMDGVLIIGGGLAAQRCAETLRKRGYEEPIRIVCAEDELPYDRPPLSKGVLAGEIEPEAVRFREPSWYADNAVELILGQRATGLDAAQRSVELADGRRLDYEDLVIATGAAPRSLPQLQGFENAISLRGLDDTRRLRAELVPGSHLVIVGAGFIGQEVAATALGLGVQVTVVEALELPLGGLLGEDVGRWLVSMHRDEGVRVLLSARLVGVSGNGRVERLELESGELLDCDAVVVGVGVAPATDWLRGNWARARRGANRRGGPDFPPPHLRRGRRRAPIRPAACRTRAHRALGCGQPPGCGRRPGDPWRIAGDRAPTQLLERPVRDPDSVRRPRGWRRRDHGQRQPRGSRLRRAVPPRGAPGGRPRGQPAA